MRFPRLSFQQSERVVLIEGAELDVIKKCSQYLHHDLFQDATKSRKLIKDLWTQDGTNNDMSLSHEYVRDTSRLFAFLQTLSGECLLTAATLRIREPDPLPFDRRCLADGLAWIVKTLDHDVTVDEDINMIRIEGNWANWRRSAQTVGFGRKFVTTESGYFALCPMIVQPGDVVCLLLGGATPYCLRPVGDHFLFLGECYVHGFMHGEGLAMLDSGGLTSRSFELHYIANRLHLQAYELKSTHEVRPVDSTTDVETPDG